MAASKTLSPEQRALRARAAANTRWSDPGARAAHVDRQLQHYADQVDPGGRLPEAERTALAKQRRRAHMQRLALASSRARRAAAASAAPPGNDGASAA